MLQISDSTIIRRKENLFSARLDSETVMMHPQSGKYFSLNEVATHIWEIIIEPCRFDKIVEKLMKEFNVNESKCRQETLEFLYILIQKDMIETEK
jgi:hypothetical protein